MTENEIVDNSVEWILWCVESRTMTEFFKYMLTERMIVMNQTLSNNDLTRLWTKVCRKLSREGFRRLGGERWGFVGTRSFNHSSNLHHTMAYLIPFVAIRHIKRKNRYVGWFDNRVCDFESRDEIIRSRVASGYSPQACLNDLGPIPSECFS